MAKKFSYLIIILSILFLTIITFLIINSQFNTTSVKDITITSCSFFTLILAILLYDRFDYRKVVFQKKFDIVLKLLVDLKSFTFHGKFIDTNYEYNIGFEIERNYLKKQLGSNHLDKVISFNDKYHERLYEKISPYFSNPFLPKEIVKGLQFLYMRNNHSINNLPDTNVIRLFFDDELPCKLDTLWYVDSSNVITLRSYIQNYIICLDIIEEWINKYSNINADLNI